MLIIGKCNVKYRELPGKPDMDVSEMFPMNWRFLPTLDPQVIMSTLHVVTSPDATDVRWTS